LTLFGILLIIFIEGILTEALSGNGDVSDEQALRERVNAFCEGSGYHLSSQADNILRDIVQMKKLTGHFYCPCQTEKVPETICVCQPVRNGLVDIMGTCFCNLIIK